MGKEIASGGVLPPEAMTDDSYPELTLTYEELKTQPRKFLTFTGLTLEEYAELLPVFEQAYLKAYPVSQTKADKPRKRKAGGGRKSSLDSMEQKLLFAMVYQKSYPLQSVQGELFGMAQSRANEWIHQLLPILKQALEAVGRHPSATPGSSKPRNKTSPMRQIPSLTAHAPLHPSATSKSGTCRQSVRG